MSVDEWLSKFRHYLELLDSGKFAQQDEMSVELFPTRHKKNPKSTYIRCKLCGQEAEENRSKNGICPDCLEKGEAYKCKKCGKEIVFTNYQKYVKGMKKHDMCKECFEYENKIRIKSYCVDCGKTFTLTNSQYDFYKKGGLMYLKDVILVEKIKHQEVQHMILIQLTLVLLFYGGNDEL